MLLTGAILVTKSASAQQGTYTWRVGGAIGYMDYYGDVSPYSFRKWADWKKAFHFFQYNRYYIPTASYGITLERKLSPTMGLLFQLDHGKFAMSDRYRTTSGHWNTQAPHWSRALNFETSVSDLGAALSFQSDNGRLLKENAFLAPYLYLGAGLTHFKVRGDLYDRSGNPYVYADPRVKPDGVYETDLRPLLTETKNEYPDITGYANVGLGIKVRLSSEASLSVETDVRYSFTDYLDDVHGQYKTAYTSAKEAYAAHPGTNSIDPVSRNRGNNDGVNDLFIFNKIIFQYSFGHKQKPRFSAPFVYEPGLVRSDAITRSELPQDTASGEADSLQGAFPVDSLSSEHSPERYLQIETDLKDIRQELLASRFTRIDQDYLIRENRIRNRISNLQASRDALRQSDTLTEEDRLEIKAYDLQIDSLQQDQDAIRQARVQLRGDVAYSPIITEYADSTRIMIYKGKRTLPESNDLPLIGMTSYHGITDSGSRYKKEYSVPEARLSDDTANKDDMLPPSLDSLRDELDGLIDHADENADSIYMERLYQLRYRIDSLDSRQKMDSGYTMNRTRIQEDSLQLVKRFSSADSLQYLGDTTRRSGIQRFLDKFRRKRPAIPDTVSTNLYRSSIPADNTMLMDTALTTYPDQDPYTALSRANAGNVGEIAMLQEEIARLKQDKEAYEKSDRQALYLAAADKREARESRKDRQALYALGRSIARSDRGSRITPAVSPTVVLNGEPSSNKKELHDIHAELAAIRNQRAEKQDTEMLRLNSRLDSISQQKPDTPVSDQTAATIRPLQSQIDSLTAQLEQLRKTKSDTIQIPARANNVFLLDHYPVISTYFATGSDRLASIEAGKLKPIAQIAKKYPQSRLIIQGYTDGTGSAAVNKRLAQNRCHTVKQILSDIYEIPEGRLQIAPMVLAEGSGRNPLQRRVDIRLSE